MKKILLISAMILTAGLFTACKDWLSIPSPTQLDNQTVFLNLDAAEMAVLGAYNTSISEAMWYEHGTNSDEARGAESDFNSRMRYANFNYNPSEVPDKIYTTMYSAIGRSNAVLKSLPSYSPANAAEQKRLNMLIGEVLVIRAMCYMQLIWIYGDVPYLDEKLTNVSFELPATSRDEIYDLCIADLQRAATELLPWKSEGMVATTERVTKNAAYGILARMALYAAGNSLRWDMDTYSPSSLHIGKRADAQRVQELYKIASDACAAVIAKGENRLLDNYDNVFRDVINNRYNAESMYECGHMSPNANHNPTRVGYTNGSAAINNNPLFARSFPMQRMMPTLWFEYADGDTRRGVTIVNHGINITGQRVLHPYGASTMGKFRANWYESATRPPNAERGVNWIWLRYSDVLLMYAEAQNELNNGPSTAAIDALKQVRTRAFGGDQSKIGTIPTDYQGFLDAIILERKLELACEGLRKADLARWGLLYETLSAEKVKLAQLARREGKYAAVPRYAAYKLEMSQLGDPMVELVPDYTYATEPDAAEKARLAAAGYTLADMNTYDNVLNTGVANFSTFFDVATGELQRWVTDELNGGLTKNKSELMPFRSTTTLQNNTALRQNPAYQ